MGIGATSGKSLDVYSASAIVAPISKMMSLPSVPAYGISRSLIKEQLLYLN